jgi:hypothetical protein
VKRESELDFCWRNEVAQLVPEEKYNRECYFRDGVKGCCPMMKRRNKRERTRKKRDKAQPSDESVEIVESFKKKHRRVKQRCRRE